MSGKLLDSLVSEKLIRFIGFLEGGRICSLLGMLSESFVGGKAIGFVGCWEGGRIR